ncbi:MAG: hypothetical protein K9J16_10970 [Melioribacteraceae bacterium]|nr:hypothetical protein [Melioribacteraceae bacterium]MCF8356559.1 hypothetical protein [Melioribacteraceae bacterium]MCF8394218.1 hypothetical protein [Melioribacteraceae bacterium]MCF8419938.1 hypothetical protein [Melioribacteraceae bacterium]
MKILLIWLLTIITILGQEKFRAEMEIVIENGSANSTYEISLLKINNIAYCYEIDDLINYSFVECVECTTGCDECNGGVINLDTDSNGDSGGGSGFGICSQGSSTISPHFGFSCYVLIITIPPPNFSKKIIYIDMRDDRYSFPWYPDQYEDDFIIKFVDDNYFNC